MDYITMQFIGNTDVPLQEQSAGADPGASFKSGAQIFIPATLKNYFKYKYLLQVSMKKCGESVGERRFLLLGKTEQNQGVPMNSAMASCQLVPNLLLM